MISLADFRADPTAAHEAGAVVLFFDAAWCGSCQATVRSLESDGVPPGLTVVRVDYDGETDLKRQYGVRVQHTFVQVDPQGAAVGVWTGSPDGQAILDEVV